MSDISTVRGYPHVFQRVIAFCTYCFFQCISHLLLSTNVSHELQRLSLKNVRAMPILSTKRTKEQPYVRYEYSVSEFLWQVWTWEVSIAVRALLFSCCFSFEFRQYLSPVISKSDKRFPLKPGRLPPLPFQWAIVVCFGNQHINKGSTSSGPPWHRFQRRHRFATPSVSCLTVVRCFVPFHCI